MFFAGIRMPTVICHFPKMAHPAADRQGAKDIISGNLKKTRGRACFYALILNFK